MRYVFVQPNKSHLIPGIVWILVSVFAIIAWLRFFNFHSDGRVFHIHEQFHYAVGSKYLAELGYYNLYPAALEAGREIGSRKLGRVWWVRNQHNYQLVTSDSLVMQGLVAKQAFSPERWREFRSDIAAIDHIATPRRWGRFVTDKGFNASPGWAWVASLFSEHIAFGNRGFTWLACLDFVSLGISFLAVGTVFGAMPLALAVVAFGFSPFCTFSFVGGGLLRHDWLCALLLGACALKKERWTLSGCCFGYAVLARVFPIVIFAAIGFVFIREYCFTRRFHSGLIRLVVGAVMIIVVITSASVMKYGTGAWVQWWQKIQFHARDIGPKRIGMEYALIYQGERSKADLDFGPGVNGRLAYENRKQVRRSALWFVISGTKALAVVGLGLTIFFSPIALLPALGLATLLIPVVSSPADYYFAFLSASLLFLSSIIRMPGGTIIGALIFLLYPLSSALDRSGNVAEFRQFVLSAYCLVLYFLELLLTVSVLNRVADIPVAPKPAVVDPDQRARHG